tara:strand:- start:408 stop:758 length:351 start_codon:yes stop_codon:yes gene_type:complete
VHDSFPLPRIGGTLLLVAVFVCSMIQNELGVSSGCLGSLGGLLIDFEIIGDLNFKKDLVFRIQESFGREIKKSRTSVGRFTPIITHKLATGGGCRTALCSAALPTILGLSSSQFSR